MYEFGLKYILIQSYPFPVIISNPLPSQVYLHTDPVTLGDCDPGLKSRLQKLQRRFSGCAIFGARLHLTSQESGYWWMYDDASYVFRNQIHR